MPEAVQGIRAPNGEIINFPASMSDDEIAAIMRREFPPQQAVASQPTDQSYSGSILPFSKNAQGTVSFDSNAGFLGAIKRGLTPFNVDTLAADQQTGEVHVNPVFVDRAGELAAMTTPINPVARTIRQVAASTPTGVQLRNTGSGQIKEAAKMGVDYRLDSVRDLASTARAKLDNDGFDELGSPRTYNALKQLENPPPNAIASLQGLISARRRLNNIITSKSVDDTERTAARRAKADIDEFIQTADSRTILRGPAGEAAAVFKEGNANYAAGARSRTLQGFEDSAELKTATSNSGRNLDNTLRKRAEWLVDPLHPERRPGFSEEEIAALRKVAEGTATRNQIREWGNRLGGGAGIASAWAGGVGAYAGGLLSPDLAMAGMVAAPATGHLLRTAANRGTTKSFRAVDEMVRQRSPLYERMMAEAPLQTPAVLEKAALLRAALLAYEAQNNPLRINVGPPGTPLR